MKKISVIGTVGLPANYGGFELFNEFLTKNLSDQYEFTVYCSSKAYDKKVESHNGAKLKYLPLNANGVQSIPYDIWSILYSLRGSDIIVVLGVSGCMILPLLRLFGCRKKIITNIDGLEWKREKWSGLAKWFLKFSEKCAVKYSDVTIGDNKVIADYVTEEYGKPCEMIEYGGDHLQRVEIDEPSCEKYPFLKSNYAFGVCRIEPENNIHMILEAFSQLKANELPLVMIGNWQRSEYGQKLWNEYSECENITLLNPIYEPEALNLIRSNCSVYVHGHSAGGTNPSLVEAMYFKLPVMAFDVNFNRETTENSALFFDSSESLTKLIKETKAVELTVVGEKMREICDRRYTWKVICEKYVELFR